MLQGVDPAALANGGALLLVMWLVFHTFKHTIPRLAKDFNTALKEQRASFIEELREERNMCREELAAQRQEFGLKINELAGAIDRLRDDLRRTAT
jgi:hypothetical protein